MKKNKKLILKNTFAIGIILIFTIILGYGIIALQRGHLIQEYATSLEFSTSQYILNLQEKINYYSKNVKKINTEAEDVVDPDTFEEFIYIGRLDKDNSTTKELNTISIRRKGEWYKQYLIDKADADIFFENRYGFVNVHKILNDDNTYANENLFFFTYREYSISKYVYMLFCDEKTFFNEQSKYGFEDSYIYDGNEILFGKLNNETAIKNSNVLKEEKTDIIRKIGAFSSKVIIEDENNKLFLVTHTSKASLDNLLSTVTSEIIISMSLYLIVVFIAVGLILYFFASENDFLKAFKAKSKDTYSLVTDEFGNILKADKKFTQNYVATNIFTQENIDDTFVKLDSKDSLYLKMKNKNGEYNILNFLCCKKNNKYKLVGIETVNLERYFMKEFGIKDAKAEMDRFKFNVERELKNIVNQKYFAIFKIPNFDEMKNIANEAKVKEIKASIMEKLMATLVKYGNTIQPENSDEIVLFIKDENLIEAFENRILNGLNELEKQIASKEISFLPQILYVKTVLDQTYQTKKYDEIYEETNNKFNGENVNDKEDKISLTNKDTINNIEDSNKEDKKESKNKKDTKEDTDTKEDVDTKEETEYKTEETNKQEEFVEQIENKEDNKNDNKDESKKDKDETSKDKNVKAKSKTNSKKDDSYKKETKTEPKKETKTVSKEKKSTEKKSTKKSTK